MVGFNPFKKKAAIHPQTGIWAQGWTDYKKHCKKLDLITSFLILYVACLAVWEGWTHNSILMGFDLFLLAFSLFMINLRAGWLRGFKKIDDAFKAQETIANLTDGSRFRVLSPEGDIIGEGIIEVSREAFHTHSSMKH